jgi:uncharacterized protein YbjQ (UPF0145 family)
MTGWNGQGLPPVAAERIRRFSESPVRTSLLSVPDAASLESVGFETVGEVMGAMVQRIGWTGYAGCGVWGASSERYGAPSVPIRCSTNQFAGFGPYVNAMNSGYETSMKRMLLEAAALGADGVVGVRWTQHKMEGRDHEFVAIGTAVRARSVTRPTYVFTTDLVGADFAKLLMSGWTPVALQIGLEVAIRHDDYRTMSQAGSRWWNQSNVEVSGYSDLVQYARGLARDNVARKARAVRADGTIVSRVDLQIREVEPAGGHTDHVAEATIMGTSIAQFDTRKTTDSLKTLTIMPTRGLGRTGRLVR